MRWYEYKMEVDDLHASDDLKAKLLAMQANAAETPGAKSIAMPAPSPTPKKQKKPLRFPARRWAQLAACVAVCGVCLYGAVHAYEWKGVTLLGGGSSSNYSAAATKAAAPQAAVYSMEDTENATYGSADNGISSFSAEDGHRSADTATGGSLLTSGEAESDASTRTADSAKIIYTANLTLETRDYDTARAALDAALSDADGYMESSSEYTNTDSTRSVSLTLRVPQDSYKSFLAAAAQSGSVTYQNQQAEDITTRYMDTEARLALAELYRSLGENGQAEALLREGISRWCTGPELYLALARSYCAQGRMEDAFSLLETAPRGYISQRLLGARPKNAQAPPSGTYPAGTALSLRPGEGDPWFSLDGEGWQPYTAPLTLEAGEHTLRVSTLSPPTMSIPSPSRSPPGPAARRSAAPTAASALPGSWGGGSKRPRRRCFFRLHRSHGPSGPRRKCGVRRREPVCRATGVYCRSLLNSKGPPQNQRFCGE